MRTNLWFTVELLSSNKTSLMGNLARSSTFFIPDQKMFKSYYYIKYYCLCFKFSHISVCQVMPGFQKCFWKNTLALVTALKLIMNFWMHWYKSRFLKFIVFGWHQWFKNDLVNFRFISLIIWRNIASFAKRLLLLEKWSL